MRDYKNIERYLHELVGDVYDQPEDETSTKYIQEAMTWVRRITHSCEVLDVGCGNAVAGKEFEKLGHKYHGLTLSIEDANSLRDEGLAVEGGDFSFLPFTDKSFDLIFSRHSLEHSPMPLITLMEWHRVSKQWLFLVVPNPEVYGYEGQNHYSVLHPEQWSRLLDRAGWKSLWFSKHEIEFWFFCERVDRVVEREMQKIRKAKEEYENRNSVQ